METKKMLKEILSKVQKIYQQIYGKNLIKVVLYGSYARGDYDQDSDIDVVGIVNGERLSLQRSETKVWDLISDIVFEYNILISAGVIPLKEFTDYIDALPYYKNIEKEGVVLNA
ncbi:DNA polymerase subunit beta [Clostridia bacterium]|nr:DNA polymerase subunit beta [Clostridia bacterium]